ncbi:DNA polymerase III, delta subunit [Loktanella sp. DSM 29012]|uniref:DNA-directed DNA polymerase n=1 Tax=Loktanella gaetbuli TaxID=2881335 RepID=A0ABS8BTM1_9RHOB|nr:MULTISPECIES: DNA polymerase III subunit delta [Loktanella]MCB5199090.1 DNA polymerase III subunit delta [Loktanella gaetbuli]SEP64454.1 DNA polymerase III, delta subunit [Loktanella sp. DSM 29012]
MKLAGRDAAGFLRKPDPTRAGILIFGADPVRVATARAQVIAALVGPQGEAEMRLTRIPAGDLRKDGAALDDAVKAQGFFPGPRVVHLDEATDGLSQQVAAALEDWREGDAQIVATAGQLTAKSALRKAFEGHRNAVAIGLYDDPPGRDEIEAQLSAAGLQPPSRDVMEAITGLAHGLTPGDFRQTIEKLGLYKRGDSLPVTVEEVHLCAPQAADVDVDDILDVVSAGDTAQIGTVLRDLYAQGVAPTTLCIGAMRHFRRLHTVASDPGGAGQGIARLRPPVFGPRRDKIMRQASHWGRIRLEQALTTLTDTDLMIRSSSQAPQAALMERTLIRLAMMARR